ncbi:MAG: Putative deoxyribonuclease YjjV [Burkholderiaceae bacterium]|jgi:TatD DNase family protein|nr:MAG: Putative deoxyribonuclease YjjV [Burkholderiaceae bacterium]
MDAGLAGWIDTHCHLDAPEFAQDRAAMRARARAAGVVHCVLPAVGAANFAAVRELAHGFGDSYALGIHPLCTAQATEADLTVLDAQLAEHGADPRLVAVGEIGLDFFVPEYAAPLLRERQEHFYREQLRIARRHGLPVLLHVRRSADRLLKYLRELAPSDGRWRGIAHAFNGSEAQAAAFIALGFKLGFGGAVTFERALKLRRLAASLPLDAIVLETDAPDIPPQWLYRTANERAAGAAQGRNEPAELPRIAAVVAALRGMAPAELAAATTRNALAALPRLGALIAA